MLVRQSATGPSTKTSQTHSPRPSACSPSCTKTLPTTPTPSTTNPRSTRRGISSQTWWLARPTRQRIIRSPYSVSKHRHRHPRRKRKGKDQSNVTWYGCGKKGHIQRKCPDGEKKDEKRDEKEDKRDDKSNLRREMTERVAPSTVGDAVSYNALPAPENC